MSLKDSLQVIADRILKQQDTSSWTEEATKNAFIMPFITALGYDVFNPEEVIPEYTADAGIKKGEKVDYAISKDSEIIILIECKPCNVDLNTKHTSQLYRYFSTTDVKFGILTNGIEYWFYSDIDDVNKMDSVPFFQFNLLSFEDHDIDELKRFTKSMFNLENNITTSSTLKYTRLIKTILNNELTSPSDQFVKFFASQVYTGKLTQRVMAEFSDIVKSARHQFIKEKIRDQLELALNSSHTNIDVVNEEPKDDGIVTTVEELEGYHIIKTLLRDTVDINRIFMRDTKSYCGILFDNNNRTPICRLYFNRPTSKRIGIVVNKKEIKFDVVDLSDLYDLENKLKEAVACYI